MSTSQELLAEWTVTPAKVSEAVRLLVQGAHPRKIIMFGSQARRGAREQSDVDLMVVTGPLEKDARWREDGTLARNPRSNPNANRSDRRAGR